MTVPQPDDINAYRPKKKLALPRIHRGESSRLEEGGDSHLWAVSYSDLLMVLMSFFVIYFSFDNADPSNSNILSIAKSMREGGAIAGGTGTKDTDKGFEGKNVAMDAGQMAMEKGTNDSFIQKLRSLNVKIQAPGDAVVLNLEDDIFKGGEFVLPVETETRLKEIYDLLTPYREQVSIVVIGHADHTKMGRRNDYLSNNFDLSSLRALKALQYFLSLGFPQDQISAQGAAENERNSRSLSLRIQLRGKKAS